jgi:hypothetical protein
MKTASLAFLIASLSITLSLPLFAANVPDISSEAELDAALAQAERGDSLRLDADIEITGTKAIPPGVTLIGNGHTITQAGPPRTATLSIAGASGVTVRNVRFICPDKESWNIQVGDGDARFVDCYFDARMIAWANGSVTVEDSTVEMQIPKGGVFLNPVMVYGNRASYTSRNCLYVLGWEYDQWAMSLFNNAGGDIASRLDIANATIVATTDALPKEGGFYIWGNLKGNRHRAVIYSNNGAGSDYFTSLTNSVIIGEASSVFRSEGSGTVVSRFNNNAGMLRNPLAFTNMMPDAPNFYRYFPDDRRVMDREGDFREYNPLVDALHGDYRLMATSKTASAATDGGPIGADLGVERVEQNAFNLSFSLFDRAENLVLPERTEDVFHGWRLHRESGNQYFLSVENGYDSNGRAIRFEARNTINETGGGFHDNYVTQSVSQTFCVIPGHLYTIRAASRRGTIGERPWTENGMYGAAVLAVANGHEPDPHRVDEAVVIKGPENEWTVGEITGFRADSNQLTVHLIHRTNGSYNRSDWDAVEVSGRPNPALESN